MKPGAHKKVGKKSDPVKPVDVDAHIPNSTDYKVLINGTKVYSIYLMLSSLAQNSNKFYIIQILEKDGHLWQWIRYGRVGYKGQTSLKMCTDIKDFDRAVKEKTRKRYTEIKMALGKEKEGGIGFFRGIW